MPSKKARELTNRDTIKAGFRWRKIRMVTVFTDRVHLIFHNGNTAECPPDMLVEIKG